MNEQKTLRLIVEILILMVISLKQLCVFITAARTESFAEAAIQLRLPQPDLSISVRNLENLLGGNLLSCTTRSVFFAPEEKTYYTIAQELVIEWEQSFEDKKSFQTSTRLVKNSCDANLQYQP